MHLVENKNSGFMTADNIFTEYPDIVAVEDMMKMLCIGRSSAYKLLNSGEIRSIRQGKVHCRRNRNEIYITDKQRDIFCELSDKGH